jgi:hypothetical protein
VLLARTKTGSTAGWENPSRISPLVPFLSRLRRATEENTAAAGADRRAEGGGAVAGPFAGARVPLAGQRTAVERSGYGALRRGRLPGRSGEWRPASSRLPFFPFSLSLYFLFFPKNSGRSRVRVLRNSSPILICSRFDNFSA